MLLSRYLQETEMVSTTNKKLTIKLATLDEAFSNHTRELENMKVKLRRGDEELKVKEALYVHMEERLKNQVRKGSSDRVFQFGSCVFKLPYRLKICRLKVTKFFQSDENLDRRKF